MPANVTHAATFSQIMAAAITAAAMHQRSNWVGATRCTTKPNKIRPTVRLPQYRLTHAPASSGDTLRASVSMLNTQLPAATSAPQYTKNSTIPSQASGSRSVASSGTLAAGPVGAPPSQSWRVSTNASASASCTAPTSQNPERQPGPAVIIAVIIAGPIVAPMPKQACSQFMARGLKCAAAYEFRLPSIAPPARPEAKPSATSTAHSGALPIAISESAARPQLAASSVPTLISPIRRPLTALASIYPAVLA